MKAYPHHGNTSRRTKSHFSDTVLSRLCFPFITVSIAVCNYILFIRTTRKLKGL